MHVCSLLTEDIGGMSFLGEGFELVVAPAILPVAVPRMFHHLGHRNDRKLALPMMNTKKYGGYLHYSTHILLTDSSTAACLHDILIVNLLKMAAGNNCIVQCKM